MRHYICTSKYHDKYTLVVFPKNRNVVLLDRYGILNCHPNDAYYSGEQTGEPLVRERRMAAEFLWDMRRLGYDIVRIVR